MTVGAGGVCVLDTTTGTTAMVASPDADGIAVKQPLGPNQPAWQEAAVVLGGVSL